MSRPRPLHLVGDFMLKQRIDVLFANRSYYDAPPSGFTRVFTCYAEYDYEQDDGAELALLEQLFKVLNVGTGTIAQAYRDKGLRSLSVGDVVVLDEELAYQCAPAGWAGPFDLTVYNDVNT